MRPRHIHFEKTLKPFMIEEPIDLHVYRPLGFWFALFFRRLSFTPNHVTFFSMLLGISAGVLYSHARFETTCLAGFLFFLANTLDCADGQLARLTGIYSPIGRIIDGAADYVTGAATTLGMAIGYASHYHPAFLWWTLVFFATVSNVFQSVWVDTYRLRFLSKTSGRAKNAEEEYKEFQTYLQKRLPFLDRLLIRAYMGYLHLVIRFSSHSETDEKPIKPPKMESVDEYPNTFIRMWMWLGSSTRITLAVIVSLFNRPEWYFIGVAIPFNFLALGLFLWQSLLETRAEEVV